MPVDTPWYLGARKCPSRSGSDGVIFAETRADARAEFNVVRNELCSELNGLLGLCESMGTSSPRPLCPCEIHLLTADSLGLASMRLPWRPGSRGVAPRRTTTTLGASTLSGEDRPTIRHFRPHSLVVASKAKIFPLAIGVRIFDFHVCFPLFRKGPKCAASTRSEAVRPI